MSDPRPTLNPPPPEDDTGSYGHLPVRRSQYRIVTNGTDYRVQVKRLWFFWEGISSHESYAYAERWIAEQIRQRARTVGPWRQA